MYRCDECGHIFEEGEQKKVSECVGEFWGSPCYQNYEVCPCCGGVYYEAKECKICGTYACEDGEDYCESCKEDVAKRFVDLIDKTFDEEEKELLIDLGLLEVDYAVK